MTDSFIPEYEPEFPSPPPADKDWQNPYIWRVPEVSDPHPDEDRY